MVMLIVGACATIAPTPVNTPQPTVAGPNETFSTAIPPAPAWRSPTRLITRQTVAEIENLGRLDFGGTPSTIFAYAFSPDGTRLVGLNNTNLVGWDLITGQFMLNNTRQNASAVFYSPDKSELYTVSSNGTVTIYGADNGVAIANFSGHEQFNGYVAYDPLNGWLALGGSDGKIHVWDALERLALAVFSAHQTNVRSMIFSPDGTQLVSSGEDGRNFLWNWRDSTMLHDLTNSGVLTIRMAYSPNGDTIAIATNELITLWDARSGQFIHSLPTGVGGSESLLLFSPDGKFLVNGGDIPDMMVWSGEADNTFLAYLPNMGQGRISAQFSPDSQMLLTSKFEGATVLWDMTQITDETVVRANLNPQTDRVVFVDWSPDGFAMLFFDASGVVHVWGLP
jgi:WD40 repeat protein